MSTSPYSVLPALLLSTTLSAQSIGLTFTANLNGNHQTLDSILVMDLTAEDDTMLYAPDTLLTLGATGMTAIDRAALPRIGAFPNPMTGKSTILLEAADVGPAFLEVTDMEGHRLAQWQGKLAVGLHEFEYNSGAQGTQLVRSIIGGRSLVTKLVSLSGDSRSGTLAHRSQRPTAAGRTRSLEGVWAPGDQLRIIGYGSTTVNGTSIRVGGAIEDAATVSSDYNLTMYAGIPCTEQPFVTDVDGNTYRTVRIGNQCWMAENLRTSHYNDGALIPNVTDNAEWAQATTAAWCNYQNDPGYDATFGKMYNWYALAVPNIAPVGWHVPTDTEWQQLELELGMPPADLDIQGGSNRGGAANVGGKMKTIDTWSTQNLGATNETGFSGLPGGERNTDSGLFDSLGDYGFWWSATEGQVDYAYLRGLQFMITGVYRDLINEGTACSVRCVKD